MYSSPVRHSTSVLLRLLVRLACVKRAASVRSEPGSNSHLVFWNWIQGPPLQYTLLIRSIQLSKNKETKPANKKHPPGPLTLLHHFRDVKQGVKPAGLSKNRSRYTRAAGILSSVIFELFIYVGSQAGERILAPRPAQIYRPPALWLGGPSGHSTDRKAVTLNSGP
jgi:hypothetical protein